MGPRRRRDEETAQEEEEEEMGGATGRNPIPKRKEMRTWPLEC